MVNHSFCLLWILSIYSYTHIHNNRLKTWHGLIALDLDVESYEVQFNQIGFCLFMTRISLHDIFTITYYTNNYENLLLKLTIELVVASANFLSSDKFFFFLSLAHL